MKIYINTNASDLLNVFFTLGRLLPVVIATMVTQSSATLIDKIYVKCDKYENVTSRTLITYISDNFPILTCLDIERVISHKKSLTFMQHQLGHSQLRNMSEALKTTDWDHVFGYDKVSECSYFH